MRRYSSREEMGFMIQKLLCCYFCFWGIKNRPCCCKDDGNAVPPCFMPLKENMHLTRMPTHPPGCNGPGPTPIQGTPQSIFHGRRHLFTPATGSLRASVPLFFCVTVCELLYIIFPACQSPKIKNCFLICAAARRRRKRISCPGKAYFVRTKRYEEAA